MGPSNPGDEMGTTHHRADQYTTHLSRSSKVRKMGKNSFLSEPRMMTWALPKSAMACNWGAMKVSDMDSPTDDLDPADTERLATELLEDASEVPMNGTVS